MMKSLDMTCCTNLFLIMLGQRICRYDDQVQSGNGTYTRSGYVCASLAGILSTKTQDEGKVTKCVKS